MSCMKEKTKSAESAAGSCCGKGDQKGCCAKSEKKPGQSAMACCAGSNDHCGMQHPEHGDMGK